MELFYIYTSTPLLTATLIMALTIGALLFLVVKVAKHGRRKRLPLTLLFLAGAAIPILTTWIPSMSHLGILMIVLYAPLVEETLKCAVLFGWLFIRHARDSASQGSGFLGGVSIGGGFAIVEALTVVGWTLGMQPQPMLLWPPVVAVAVNLGLTHMLATGAGAYFYGAPVLARRSAAEKIILTVAIASGIHAALNLLKMLVPVVVLILNFIILLRFAGLSNRKPMAVEAQ